MTLNSEIRSQFTVFAFFQDLDLGTQIRTGLAMDGYEAFAFMDYDTVLERLRQGPPHILVFNLEALMGTLSEFVEKVLEINSEVLFLPVVDAAQVSALEAYREYNFANVVTTGADLELRVRWSIDQICSELYFTYQNEQLVEERTESLEEMESLRGRLESAFIEKNELEAKLREAHKTGPFLVREAMAAYLGMTSKEDLVGTFFNRLTRHFSEQELHGLYLKYLPTVHNLVATQAMGLSIEKLKGIGAKLSPEEIQQIDLTLARHEVPESVRKLMHEGFGVGEFVPRGLLIHRNVDGVFVFWSRSAFDVDLLDNEFMTFSQCFQIFDLGRRFDQINFEDPVTGVDNREYYFLKLEEEVARSRRLQKAVSVVKISFDDWEGILKQGGVVRDTYLRTLASLIKKSSRTNDLVCRTLDNEISLILPHSARKGAAIRAERLRRMVETHNFQYAERPLSISCGISEYPSFCASAAELDHSAGQALNYIRSRGGNKVCLYRPVGGFKPDFDVPPI